MPNRQPCLNANTYYALNNGGFEKEAACFGRLLWWQTSDETALPPWIEGRGLGFRAGVRRLRLRVLEA